MKAIRCLHISDIHIGSNKVPAEHTVTSIKKVFLENSEKVLDSSVIFITGDTTDMLLSTRSNDYFQLLDLFFYLAEISVKQNKWLIYLEGTPLHEMGQMENVFKVITKVYPSLKYRYYTTIGTDYIEELDMSILHIPDLIISNSSLKNKIDKLLDKKVDITLTHAFYKHHINLDLPNLRDADYFSSITKHIVLNGHDHNNSYENKVYTVGSFDRKAHNEEKKKGLAYISLHPELNPVIEFVNNPYATRHDTLGTNDMGKILKRAHELNKHPISYLRINADLGKKSKEALESKFKNIVIEFKAKKVKKKKEEVIQMDVLEISKHNIKQLMSTRLKDFGKYQYLLEEVI